MFVLEVVLDVSHLMVDGDKVLLVHPGTLLDPGNNKISTLIVLIKNILLKY